MSKYIKAWVEKNFKVKLSEGDIPVLAQLNKNSGIYDKNFHELMLVDNLIQECQDKDKKRVLEKERNRLLAMERKLNNVDIRLRKELGIYLSEPCPGIKCYGIICESRKCKRLKNEAGIL